MKLWLYSSGDAYSNQSMDRALLRNLAHKKPTFTFIPTSFEEADDYYDEFIDRFSNYAFIRFNLLHADRKISRQALNRAMNSEVIYLSGGNTFHLLRSLRQSQLIDNLKYFVRTGGILAGHSAGAIVMTPSIETAAYPDFDCDENDVGIQDWRALRLVHFHFFPHYSNHPRYSFELASQSRRQMQLVYGVPDGSGVVVMSRQTSFFGPIWGFVGGHKFKLTK